MKRCSACTKPARSLQRALILSGPGKVRGGRVCQGCARLGWLFVFGEEQPARAPLVKAYEQVLERQLETLTRNRIDAAEAVRQLRKKPKP